MLIVDQGAVVTLNGGATWTHLVQPADRAALSHRGRLQLSLPRSAAASRRADPRASRRAATTARSPIRDWLPVGVDEYGYAAPDPLNPHLVYGGRNVTRFDYRTGQTSTVGPAGGRGGGAAARRRSRSGRCGRSRSCSPRPTSARCSSATTTCGRRSTAASPGRGISDDLTRKTHDAPKSIGTYTTQAQPQLENNGARVIYTIGPSPIDVNRIWIGTDDGVIQTTADGGMHWTRRHAAADRRLLEGVHDRRRPLRRADGVRGGQHAAHRRHAAAHLPHARRRQDVDGDRRAAWTTPAPANAVREDPKKRGLLYASTEKGVYVSFDDGDRWQSLRLNLPASSVRDLIVKDDDIAVATHGRGFWILDDITPLRQIDAATAGPRRGALQAGGRVARALEHSAATCRGPRKSRRCRIRPRARRSTTT